MCKRELVSKRQKERKKDKQKRRERERACENIESALAIEKAYLTCCFVARMTKHKIFKWSSLHQLPFSDANDEQLLIETHFLFSTSNGKLVDDKSTFLGHYVDSKSTRFGPFCRRQTDVFWSFSRHQTEFFRLFCRRKSTFWAILLLLTLYPLSVYLVTGAWMLCFNFGKKLNVRNISLHVWNDWFFEVSFSWI